MPFFSVVIPTYNRLDLLKKTLESVFKQTFKNFEIITIDNFSSDNTEKYIKNIKKKNLIYKKINNNGIIGISRNEGIKIAKGQWIAFLDSDDTWKKNKLLTVYNSIKKNKSDLFFHNIEIIKKKKSKIIFPRNVNYNDFFKDLLVKGNIIPLSSAVVNKNFLLKNNLKFTVKKEMITVEDYDFFLKIALKKAKFYFIKKKLGTCLVHQDGLSRNTIFHYKAIKYLLKFYVYQKQNFNKNKINLLKLLLLRHELQLLKYYLIKIKLLSITQQLFKIVITYNIKLFNFFYQYYLKMFFYNLAKKQITKKM